MNIVAIIPARGNSKGLKDKNKRLLGGCPLVTYTIGHAIESVLVDRVIVSTEDEDIARISLDAGAEVPFLRPEYLSQDLVIEQPILAHVIRHLDVVEDYRVDVVVLLSCTFPLRSVGLIDKVVSRLIEDEAMEISTVVKVVNTNIWTKNVDGGYNFLTESIPPGPRQVREPIYADVYGLCVAYRVDLVRREQRFSDKIALVVNEDPKAVIDIDGEFELSLVEKIFADMDCSKMEWYPHVPCGL